MGRGRTLLGSPVRVGDLGALRTMTMATLYCGDALTVLRRLPNESVRMVCTSPPYWGLRMYGTAPQVFGGDADCAHEWTEHLQPAANGLVNNTMQGETLSGRSATRTPKVSAFCQCGAWRGELGLEPTPELYIEHMVMTFREVRRVLAEDGTLWLNMGDSYCTTPRGNRPGDFSTSSLTNPGRQDAVLRGRVDFAKPSKQRTNTGSNFAGPHRLNRFDALKGKDLVGMPWRLAFALQADGWWLRSDIIWSKPNPMPESVTDRPTTSHEHVFLLSKAAQYYYDAAAIRTPLAAKTFTTFGTKHHPAHRCLALGVKSDNWGRSVETRKPKEWKKPAGWDTEPGAHGTIHRQGRSQPPHGSIEARKARANPMAKSSPTTERNGIRPNKQRGHGRRHDGFNDRWDQMERDEQISYGANARSVWEIAPQNYPEAHFATFPEELARRCILAGSRPGDTVLDPFGGSGTVAQVATGNGRDSIYIDLNPKYLELARQRIGPMLCEVEPEPAA